MAVYGCHHAMHHIHAHSTAGHLGDTSERHVVDKEYIQIRFALLLALFLDMGQDLIDQSGQTALCIIHLTDGIVHAKLSGPGVRRDLMTEELCKLFDNDDNKLSNEHKTLMAKKNELIKVMQAYTNRYHLTKNDLEKYAVVQSHKFSHLLSQA